MIIYILITITIILFCIYIIQNLYKKFSDLEKKIVDYETFIINIHDKVEFVNKEIKRLDKKEMFEKDDEVGIIFQRIVEIINILTFELEKD